MVLSVLIIEDNRKQREYIENVVNDYIALKDYNMEVVLSTDNPEDLLDYAKAHPKQNKLYILDVHLRQYDINGITLAQQVRAYDAFGKFVFVTAHAELSHLVFKYHIEALDYILKGDASSVAQQIQDCLEVTYKRCLNASKEQEYFQIKSSGSTLKIPVDDIVSFESCISTNKKLILNTVHDRFEFRGTLKEIAKKSSSFCHCHKAYVINTKNIKSITRLSAATGAAEMINGAVIPVNKASIVPLKKLVMAQT
ncbi:MAG: LytTR family DNA-binding domain-containing protein [Oscillospiraceae bacterium]|nr:LytTR family DNA-binding domain-containing protein [Oscillospiraceae bacterium]